MDSLKKGLNHYLKVAEDWKKLSCVSRNYPPSFSHKLRSLHGGIKPPELCVELISAFGKNTKNIIDPFAGAGSSLIAASILGKNALGIDINATWKEIYNRVCQENQIPSQEFFVDDAEVALKKLKENHFDLVITDVPYFNMDQLSKTRGKFSRAGEKSKEKLPSSLNKFNNQIYQSVEEWLEKLRKIFKNLIPLMCNDAIFIVFIGNMYRNTNDPNNLKDKIGKYFPLSSELAQMLKTLKLQWIKELIWIDPGKKLGIYGYPYVFIPSILDQRILILKK